MHIDDSIKTNLDNLMIKLISDLNCDVGKIIGFSHGKAYALVEQIYIVNSRYSYLSEVLSRIINLCSNKPDTILNLVIQNQKQILSRNINRKDNMDPLIDSVQLEICIPVFIQTCRNVDNLTWCIYLGSFDINKTSSINEKAVKEAGSIIASIQEDLAQIYNQSERLNNLFDMIYIFLEVMKSRDGFAINHAYNVAHWTKKICEKLNLTSEVAEEIYLAAILHDFGNIYDIDEIERKQIMKQEKDSRSSCMHPIYSYNIGKVLLYNLCTIEDIPKIIKHHHDRFDGMDCLDGLKGEEIPLGSRILAIAEYLDEILTYGLNKEIRSTSEIIKEFIRQKGKRFDPKLTDIIINLLVNIRKNTSSILENSILWSTMTIYMIDKVVHLEGTLIKKDFGYVFKTDKLNFLKDIKKKDIINVSLYMENRNDVYEFSVQSFNLQENTVYLSGLYIKPSADSFSLLWELPGRIENIEYGIEITIYKIGGHSLSFYGVETDKLKKYRDDMVDKTLTLSIVFEDSSMIRISGIVTETYNIGGRYYFNFKYVNIPERSRDEIFKRIFKKQIENRKLLNN